MRKTVDLSKSYSFPKTIAFIKRNDVQLVIAVETAKWIVLKNDSQTEFFNLLRYHSIQVALDNFKGAYSDAVAVITQIEARKFDNSNVISCISNDTKSLQLYLTNACNLRCPHCYMFAGKPNEKELTTQEVEYIAKEFKKYGGNKVTLSGGEICMRQDMQDIILSISKVGLNVRLLTNGILWKENLIKTVAPFLSSIQISVDGFNEESNSQVRGAGSFAKSLATIDRFVSLGVPTEVAITPFYDGKFLYPASEFAKFCQFLTSKYKGRQISIKIAKELMDGRKIHLTSKDKQIYRNYIDEIYNAYYGEDVSDYSFIQHFRQDIIMDNCMYGALSISSTGDVFMCSRIPLLKSVGNIRNAPFGEFVQLSKIAQKWSNVSNLEPCSSCVLRYICGGGCRVEYFPEFVNTPDIRQYNGGAVRTKCTEEEKNALIDLMIKNNEKLFV